MVFSEKEMLEELNNHPERFSPNVILRGIYQETILPNIAFIGGGGELAYWLQLKDLFDHFKTSFPVLVLRNSFLITEKNWHEKIGKLNLQTEDFFKTEIELMNVLVKTESQRNLQLNGQLEKLTSFYAEIKDQAEAVDQTLSAHVEALKTAAIKKLNQLEKKMLRVEKRKFAAQQNQIQKIKQQYFPKNGLQERVENFIPFYAKYGKEFIDQLYRDSLGLEQEFSIIQIME
jgi:bacillithiol synthase